MKKESALPPLGAVYSMYIKELRRYGAYQILQSDQKSICYIVLDYLEEVPPDPESITLFQPFYQERFRFHHQLHICQTSNAKVPRDYLFVGIYPPVVKKVSSCFCGEWGDGKEYIYEMEWNTADPKQKAAYKKFCNSREMVKVGKQHFKKNLNGMKTELYRIIGKEFPMDLFPCITFVEIKGAQEGLIECLEQAALVHTLRWWTPQIEILDLRKTAIRYLQMDVDGVKQIYLSPNMRKIELYGRIDPKLQIYGEPEELDLELSVTWQPDGIHSYGLKHVGKLQIVDIKEQDLMEVLPLFWEVTALSLQGHPGVLRGLEGLWMLPKLRELEIQDLFGYTVDDIQILKQLPELRRLSLLSVPKEIGTIANKVWKEKLDFIEIKRLRSEEWRKENLENPFRDWDGKEGIPVGVFKKAFEQYKRTKRAFMQARDREAVILAIKEYAIRFNRLNQYYAGVMQTEERENIFAVLERIYQETVEDKGWFKREEVKEMLLSQIWGTYPIVSEVYFD